MARQPHPADVAARAEIARASYFIVSLFRDRQWLKWRRETLAEARMVEEALLQLNPARRPMIYAELPEGVSHLVPADYPNPTEDTMTTTISTTEPFTSRLYSDQSNARRAMRKHCANDNRSTGDFDVIRAPGGFVFIERVQLPASNDDEPRVADTNPILAEQIEASTYAMPPAHTPADDGLDIPPVLDRIQGRSHEEIAAETAAVMERHTKRGLTMRKTKKLKTPTGRKATGLGMAVGEAKGRAPAKAAKKAKATSVSISDLATSDHPVAKANAESWDKVTKPKKAPRAPKAPAVPVAVDAALAHVFVGVKKPNVNHMAALAAARAGKLPEFPGWDAPSYTKYYKPRLEEVKRLTCAKDVDALRALNIPTYDGCYALLARLRNLAVIALEAQAAKAAG